MVTHDLDEGDLREARFGETRCGCHDKVPTSSPHGMESAMSSGSTNWGTWQIRLGQLCFVLPAVGRPAELVVRPCDRHSPAGVVAATRL
ncbi:hypothetical protein P6B95_03460 [Streptomyces atratus]|uniref:hypothetical protein n=1 Tax=Streptomyces atratus TaxID=1893 RepID=UPI00166F8D81|nr:hypothetical protein [Streptomyces atratus]WPW26585.1 hypothetical protein P6B95_03460 [Streptomyces atratus]GGT64732.1 hypothetical protein GCM10010207_74960 [Streptomyces atratus]